MNYWRSACGLRLRPARADIDPAKMPRAALPHVMMIDVLGANDFRYRLIGTGITTTVGRDLTGQSVAASSYGTSCQLLSEAYRHVALTGQPTHAVGTGRWAAHHWKFRAIILPLGTVDAVNILLGAAEFERIGRGGLTDEATEILSLDTEPLAA
jgi:hypothetical protein